MKAGESVRFDRAADYYDATRGFPAGEEHAVAEMIARAAGLNSSSNVLEVGVGTGRLSLPLSSHTGSLVGLDLSRPMMEVLRAKPSAERLRLVEGNVTRLPFPDDAFDAVLVAHVFHLIPDWPLALNEVARVLATDGILIHSSNDWKNSTGSLATQEDAWSSTVMAENHRLGIPCEHRNTFLADSGWRRVSETERHPFTFHIRPRD